MIFLYFIRFANQVPLFKKKETLNASKGLYIFEKDKSKCFSVFLSYDNRILLGNSIRKYQGRNNEGLQNLIYVGVSFKRDQRDAIDISTSLFGINILELTQKISTVIGIGRGIIYVNRVQLDFQKTII